MKTATYHQPESEGNRTFAVLKEHSDGTVDLGPENGEPVITKCEVTAEPTLGACTINAAAKPETKPAK